VASDTLKRYFASNPVDSTAIYSIEIISPALSGGALRFADWHETVRLRTAAGWHDFNSASMSPPLPNKGERGLQEIALRIGDVQRQSWAQARLIIDYRRQAGSEPTIISLRSHLSADTATEELLYSGEAKSFTAEGSSIIVSAGFKEIVNKNAMFDEFTALNSPGLKYT